jgi:hypothetical protein
LDFSGNAFPGAENILFNPIISNGVFSASQNGMLLYQQGSLPAPVVVFPNEGKTTMKFRPRRPTRRTFWRSACPAHVGTLPGPPAQVKNNFVKFQAQLLLFAGMPT